MMWKPFLGAIYFTSHETTIQAQINSIETNVKSQLQFYNHNDVFTTIPSPVIHVISPTKGYASLVVIETKTKG